MTDAKQKPREGFLELLVDGTDSEGNEFTQCDLYYKKRNDTDIHVIEKAAYDKLLVRIERTKSAAYHALLQMSAWIGIPEHKRMEQIKYLMENVNYCADIDIQDDEAKNE